MDVANVIKRYREIKAERDALTKGYNDRLTIIEDALRKHMAETNQTSAKYDTGVLSFYERRNVKCTDLGTVKAAHPEFIKESIDSTEVLAWMDDNKDQRLPDGISLDITKVLSVKGPS